MSSQSCSCGCSTLPVITNAEDACGCSCDCCGPTKLTREEEIAQLRSLRESVEKRLKELEPDPKAS